jgi:hypothetical protein
VDLSVKALTARVAHPPRSTIRRTGRLDTPSVPVSSSAFAARPQRHVAVPAGDADLIQHAHLAAAVALDAQEP